MKGSEKKENQTRQRVNFLAHSFIQKCYFMPIMCRAFHKDLGLHMDSPASSPLPCRRLAALLTLDSF